MTPEWAKRLIAGVRAEMAETKRVGATVGVGLAMIAGGVAGMACDDPVDAYGVPLDVQEDQEVPPMDVYGVPDLAEDLPQQEDGDDAVEAEVDALEQDEPPPVDVYGVPDDGMD